MDKTDWTMKIVGATAKTTSDVVAAGCLNGFGVGFVFTSYAGIAEMVPNKWRYVLSSSGRVDARN